MTILDCAQVTFGSRVVCGQCRATRYLQSLPHSKGGCGIKLRMCIYTQQLTPPTWKNGRLVSRGRIPSKLATTYGSVATFVKMFLLSVCMISHVAINYRSPSLVLARSETVWPSFDSLPAFLSFDQKAQVSRSLQAQSYVLSLAVAYFMNQNGTEFLWQMVGPW
jgi:hypothetical protein